MTSYYVGSSGCIHWVLLRRHVNDTIPAINEVRQREGRGPLKASLGLQALALLGLLPVKLEKAEV